MSYDMLQPSGDPFAGLFRSIVDRPGTPRPPSPRKPKPPPKPKRVAKPKPTPKPKPANPWGLTAAEEAALCAMVEHGYVNRAAASLEVCLKTLDNQMRSCRKKMHTANSLLAILEWDRYARGGA